MASGNTHLPAISGAQRSWCLTGADGATIPTGGGVETITPPSGSRVVIDVLFLSGTGSSNRWSLSAGGNVVFADTDIILDDISPSLSSGGRISINGGNAQTNWQNRFAVDEVIVITNIATGAIIAAVWHYEELR